MIFAIRRRRMLLAALDATLGHGTAFARVRWSPREPAEMEAPEGLPAGGTEKCVVDMAAHRVAYEGAGGVLDTEPVPAGTPIWLIETCRGVTLNSRRGRRDQVADERWTRYWCICDVARAAGLSPVRLAPPHPGAESMQRLQANVWLDETGLIRQVWARFADFEASVTLWHHGAPDQENSRSPT